MATKKPKRESHTKTPVKKISKTDKEIYWILGIMLVVILIFIFSTSILTRAPSFKYEGLKFTKTSFGDIALYHYSYYSTQSSATGAAIGESPVVNLYLRIDPRENNVPAEGEIFYPREDNAVYISIDPENISQCQYSNVAVSNLAAFISANQYAVRSAYANEEKANETGKPYVTCDTFDQPGVRKKMVILLSASNETRIVREDTCYKIEIADCEILPAVEKFMVQSIIDAKAREEATS